MKLRYINHYNDRHGRHRYYFRAGKGAPNIPLPGKPGSPEFLKAYAAALEAIPKHDSKPLLRLSPEEAKARRNGIRAELGLEPLNYE